MNQRLLHTPDGVRDIYGDELARKQKIEHSINDTIHSFGYNSIQTPTFEFFDIFSSNAGTTHSREWFKFFDREGNTLVLRPDITPSIARAAAKYFTEDDSVIRLCYKGNVFNNNTSYQGRLKESTQLGAELIGDASADADSEVIALVVECLRAIGLSDFQISIGHADIYKGLIEAAGFDEDAIEAISTLIENRNIFGVEEFLDAQGITGDLKRLFDLVCHMYTSPDDWKGLLEAAESYPVIAAALKRLSEVNDILKIYGVDRYVSFEPGLMSYNDYYTGVIFSGYTYGSGEPVVNGGRYDTLLHSFGKDAPAIGFAFTVDQLMLATSRQEINMGDAKKKHLIIYHPSQRINAIHLAGELRNAGETVILMVCKEDQNPDELKKDAGTNVTVTTLS